MVAIPVPCGRCPECIKRRVSAWSFRLMQEDRIAIASHFITLTYDTAHVPISKKGYMSVSKTDIQKFIKRLRKSVSLVSDVPVKYYLCAEYGGRTDRPHYHIILFNVSKLSHIEDSWGLGMINYGKVSGASVGYCLKYISKEKKIPKHKNDDRIPEFALMSKRLGMSYLTDEVIKYHKEDLLNRMCLTVEGGKKVAMCRYYKEKIYTEFERSLVGNYQKDKVLQKEIKEEKAYEVKYPNSDYQRDKVEKHLQQFRNQINSSKKRDKL